jgi:hypothetical protein
MEKRLSIDEHSTTLLVTRKEWLDLKEQKREHDRASAILSNQVDEAAKKYQAAKKAFDEALARDEAS